MSEPTHAQAYKTTLPHLAELSNHLDRELGLSDWVLISQDRIDAFAAATEDDQWIHLNPEMARRYSPFPGTIAHGFLILSLASKFCYDTFHIDDVGMALNYGLDRVRFPQAVPAGSLVRGRVRLIGLEEMAGGARFKLEVTIELQGAKKPACVAEFISQVFIKPEGQDSAPDRQQKAGLDSPREVRYEKDGTVALITLNRPDRYNAVNPALNEALRQALDHARRDDGVRAVVLTGAGSGFCAGADLEVFSEELDPHFLSDYLAQHYPPLLRAFFSLGKPIIGAVNGTAAGVGAALALACDLRVMAEDSHLLYAFINIGLGPDGGASWLLARQVGYSRAFEIALEGKKIPADRCLELGLTNKVVAPHRLLEEALAWARRLAERPTLAAGITKADLHYALNHDLYETILFEAEQQRAAFASYDLREGVTAFLHKRPARFIGR